MNNELLTIMDSLEREKGISKEILFEAIEIALASAAKKILGKNKEDIKVVVNRESGSIKVSCEGKTVASDEFGRIAAQTAKQVIIQKIREAERDVIFAEYQQKRGGIASGMVHRFEKGNIVIDLGKTEAILPRSEQIQKERYRQGERVRAYIVEVNKTAHGPQIILSRRSPEFVKKLFELEVPEILEGIVEIKDIAREPGERTKIAVSSKEEKVDPVGSCVGMRGARVKDIVKELHGERIDVVRWDDNVEKYLKNALNPVEITRLTMDREKNHIEIVVKDEQLSIGIGKHGQNIRLASQLIGWNVDIRGEKEVQEKAKEKTAALLGGEDISEKDTDKEKSEEGKSEEGKSEEDKPEEDKPEEGKSLSVSAIKGVGKSVAKALTEAGWDSVEKIAGASVDELTKVQGVGKKGAESMILKAKELIKPE